MGIGRSCLSGLSNAAEKDKEEQDRYYCKKGNTFAETSQSPSGGLRLLLQQPQGSDALILPHRRPTKAILMDMTAATPCHKPDRLGFKGSIVPPLALKGVTGQDAWADGSADLIKASPGREGRQSVVVVDQLKTPWAEAPKVQGPKILDLESVRFHAGLLHVRVDACAPSYDTDDVESFTSQDTSSGCDPSDGEATLVGCGVPITHFLAPTGQTSWRWSEISREFKEGEGGQAEVWSCRLRDSQPFCVKIAKDVSGRLAVATEAELGLGLAHPNLLTSFARVTDDHGNILGVAMELLTGDDLLEALAPYNDPLTTRQIAQVARDVADGMDYLHSQGILHLDIKPSNVLLEAPMRRGHDAPRAVLADLGLSCRLEEGKSFALVDTISGSLPYLDHELVRGEGKKQITAATDVFSFGMTLYHMLSREQPFQELSSATQLSLMAARERQKHVVKPEGCDDQLWALIKGCTRALPRQRLKVPAILDRLDALLATA